MKRLIAAIAAMIGAFKTVSEWCWKTGKWVTKSVLAPFGSGASPVPAMADEPDVPAAVVEAGELTAIRNLAGAMAAGRETAEDLEPVADARIEWLAAMDRPMLARLLCADDYALKNHLRGERSIRGVLAADPDSVAEYNRAMAIKPDDFEETPNLAYAA